MTRKSISIPRVLSKSLHSSYLYSRFTRHLSHTGFISQYHTPLFPVLGWWVGEQFFHCLLILDTSQPVLAHPSRVAPSLFRIVAAPLFSDTRDHVLTGFFSFISISFIILFLTFTPLFCSAQKPRPLCLPSHLPPPFRRLRLE